MLRTATFGVFSQAWWPGRGGGSLDDCGILADFMAAHIVGPDLPLPSMEEYRATMGVPDSDSAINGISLDDSIQGLRSHFPDLRVEKYQGDFATFIARVYAGEVASASVLSGSLPAALQFGFKLNHRITIFWNGRALRVLNPLAPPHSRPKSITEAELRRAMAAYPYAEEANAVLVR